MESKSLKRNINTNSHKEFKIKDNYMATTFNRVMAYIVDLALMIILSIVLNTVLFHQTLGFSSLTSELTTAENNIYTALNDTKLYKYSSSAGGLVDDDTYFQNMVKEQASTTLTDVENPLYYYYVTYEKETINDINKEVFNFTNESLSNDYFATTSLDSKCQIKDDVLLCSLNYISGTYSANDKKVYTAFEEYYMELVSKARDVYTSNEGYSYHDYYLTYSSIIEDMTMISSIGGMISYAISGVLLYVIVPLIFKKKTLGQMLFKIRVVYGDDEEIKYTDIITRFIMMIPILFVGIPFGSVASYGMQSVFLPFIKLGAGNYITYFVPMIVSACLNLLVLLVISLNKTKQAYYDRAFNYVMVTYNERQINKGEFKNEK